MSENLTARPERELRSAYRSFRDIPTRWMDNDAYGHVNNVVYYSWFDTAVNAWLIEKGLLDLQSTQILGVVAQTHCNFFESVSFPATVQAGLRLSHLGSSSARYEIAIFGRSDWCVAKGHFVHVYVDGLSRRPVKLSDSFKTVLETLR